MAQKRCVPCSKKRHSQCTGKSSNGGGEPCPCCGNLNREKRKRKESVGKLGRIETRYEANYRHYGAIFDWYIENLRKEHKTDNVGIIPHLPSTDAEIRRTARVVKINIGWLRIFIAEHREDFGNK